MRRTVNEHLPDGYVEDMTFGMITWSIPLADFPGTYNGQALPIAALASQKTGVSLHLMGVYGDTDLHRWFQSAWKSTGRKLDMGKACVRFRALEEVPLEVVGEVIARVPPGVLIARHESAHRTRNARKTKRPVRRPPGTRVRPAR